MKNVLKQLFFTLSTPFAGGLGKSASVLMYHSVGTNAAEFTVSPDAFREQLTHIKKNYTILHFSELVRRIMAKESIAGCVCITFDDGYEDNYNEVFPFMRKMHIPISFFLTTAALNSTRSTTTGISLPMLTTSEIQEMQKSELVEFLPHGANHIRLDRADESDARKEILESLQAVQEITGKPQHLYAYATGKYSHQTIEVLKELGVSAACTVQPGLVREDVSLYEIPRNHIDAHTSVAEFRARLTSAGEWYENLKKVR